MGRHNGGPSNFKLRDRFHQAEYFVVTQLTVFCRERFSMSVKTETPKVGVGVIIFNDKGKVLVGKRISKKDRHGDGEWSLPGGHVEKFEHPKESARRELFEETGLECEDLAIWKPVPYVNHIFKDTGRHYITLYFIAQGVRGELENREPHKCEEWRWSDPANLPRPLFEWLDKVIRGEQP